MPSICAGALSLASVQPVDAASILRFYDAYSNVGAGVVGTALTELGETPTGTGTGSVATSLASQSWDLLIIDVPGTPISAADAAAIATYISGGGSAILSYWGLDSLPALATAFDVSVAASINGALSVFDWNAGSPASGNLTGGVDLTDRAGDNGDRLTAINGATAIAGFVAAPTAGEAAIVVGNGGRTIANGFLFWDMGDNPTRASIDLVKGQIGSLVDLAPVPLPASLPVLLLGLGSLCLLRRKRGAAHAA